MRRSLLLNRTFYAECGHEKRFFVTGPAIATKKALCTRDDRNNVPGLQERASYGMKGYSGQAKASPWEPWPDPLAFTAPAFSIALLANARELYGHKRCLLALRLDGWATPN